MFILIDECLDWRLGRALTGHSFASVPGMGWAGMKNGRLLAQIEQSNFDVFLTGDQNLSFQQNIKQLRFSIVVLAAPGTQLIQTLPLMPKVLNALPTLTPGQILRISA